MSTPPRKRGSRRSPGGRQLNKPLQEDVRSRSAPVPEGARKHRRGAERRLEGKVYGFNACLMLFEHRPEEVVRGYFSERVAKRCGPLMKELAARKMAYQIVSDEEMERISGSLHHEGICLLVKRRAAMPFSEWLAAREPQEPLAIVGLVGVSNPHNLGALVRTCAHFGIVAVVTDKPDLLQSGAAVRTAQGGSEFVEILSYDRVTELVRTAQEGAVKVMATSSRGSEDLYRMDWPRRGLVLLGEEGRGLSEDVLRRADYRVRIPGTGVMESLNVSAAAAVILGEWWRKLA